MPEAGYHLISFTIKEVKRAVNCIQRRKSYKTFHHLTSVEILRTSLDEVLGKMVLPDDRAAESNLEEKIEYSSVRASNAKGVERHE